LFFLKYSYPTLEDTNATFVEDTNTSFCRRYKDKYFVENTNATFVEDTNTTFADDM
jgi:hypothetical protein